MEQIKKNQTWLSDSATTMIGIILRRGPVEGFAVSLGIEMCRFKTTLIFALGLRRANVRARVPSLCNQLIQANNGR